MKKDPYTRFMANVQKTDSCWIWIGRSLKTTGRAVFRANAKSHIAARWLWIHINGPLNLGMCVLHKCDNVKCVNPSHLFIGTQLQNIKDRDEKGRNRLSATHCVNGHEFSLENTRFYGPEKRWRMCRACSRDHSENYRKSKSNMTREEAEAY